jgi:glucose/arabinose dehydrogenase
MNSRVNSRQLLLVGTVLLAVAASAGLLAAARRAPLLPETPAPADLARLARLDLLTRDTTEPVALVAAPGEPAGRMFVVEKRGRIRILRGKKLEPQPFLDLTGKVALDGRDDGEQGLLGLAFHPQFQSNGRFYLNFTDPKGDTKVVELRTRNGTGTGTSGDPGSARTLLAVAQPASNHNGGDVQFGRDGKLYVLLGDGGGANDPDGNAQNPRSHLGKALRIDVDARQPRPEVVGRGLRNPWRYSFDPRNGDLYIADVGQDLWEYVHVVPGGKLAGHNFGWNIVEGNHCFQTRTCDRTGLHPPVFEYAHREGCSITGGHVYRGKALPELEGVYFFSDYCTAMLRSFRYARGKVTDLWDWKTALDPDSEIAKVASFGVDQAGELYLVSHEGPLYKLVRR